MKKKSIQLILGLSLMSLCAMAEEQKSIDLKAYQTEVNESKPGLMIYDDNREIKKSEVSCIQRDPINWNNVFGEGNKIREHFYDLSLIQNRFVLYSCNYSAKFDESQSKFVPNIKIKLQSGEMVDASMSVYAEATSTIRSLPLIDFMLSEAKEACKDKAMMAIENLISEKGYCQ